MRHLEHLASAESSPLSRYGPAISSPPPSSFFSCSLSLVPFPVSYQPAFNLAATLLHRPQAQVLIPFLDRHPQVLKPISHVSQSNSLVGETQSSYINSSRRRCSYRPALHPQAKGRLRRDKPRCRRSCPAIEEACQACESRRGAAPAPAGPAQDAKAGHQSIRGHVWCWVGFPAIAVARF
jgi:hypothetical protein